MVNITGEWVRNVREQLGLTQAQFAKRLGVTQTAVAYWENDQRTPQGPARILLEMLGSEAERVSAEKISA